MSGILSGDNGSGKTVREAGVSPPPSSKEGDGYDRCPEDGCIEVDRSFKHGGTDTRGEQYLNWSMYNADVRKGGCGTNWTRTTKQGVERDQRRGVNPKWLTGSALSGRYTDVPSRQYQDRYACAFHKCGCDVCPELISAGLTARCGPAHHV